MSRYDDCPEVCIKLSHFSLHGFGKRDILVLNGSESQDRRKTENVSLGSHN